jgi:hypothetical protein
MKSDYYKITVEAPDGDKLVLTVYKHSHIFDWSKPFAVILTWVGFGVNTIGEILTREDDMEEDDE